MNFEENESKEQGIQDFLSIIALIRTIVKTMDRNLRSVKSMVNIYLVSCTEISTEIFLIRFF